MYCTNSVAVLVRVPALFLVSSCVPSISFKALLSFFITSYIYVTSFYFYNFLSFFCYFPFSRSLVYFFVTAYICTYYLAQSYPSL
jgi:hypothetical protein